MIIGAPVAQHDDAELPFGAVRVPTMIFAAHR